MDFLTGVLNGLKYCTARLERVGLHVTNRNFTDFSFINVDFKQLNRPSARCATAAIGIGSDIDIVSVGSVSVNVVNWRLIPSVHNLVDCLKLYSCSKSNLCVIYFKLC
jgi:hypothetical protein